MPKRSRAWRFLFVLHLYALLGLLAIGTILGCAGLAIWKVPSARSWAHSEWVRLYLRNVAPKLPFTIENIDVETKWNDFVRGKLANIHLDLDWSGWKISFAGPVDAFYDHREPETHINAVYDAVVRATPPGKKQKPLPPLPLRISFRAGDHFSHLDTLNIDTKIQDLSLSRFGARARDLSLAAGWDDGTASLRFSAGELSISGSSVSNLALSASGPLKLKPFTPGPDLTADLSVSRAVTEMDGMPLDLPLAKFPVHARLSLAQDRIGFDVSAGGPSPALTLSGALETPKKIPTRLDVSWKTPELTLRELIAAARAIRSDLPLLRSLKWLKKLSGSVGTSGTAHLDLPVSVKNLEHAEMDADVRVRKLGFEWPGRYLALSGANLDFPISSRKGIAGKVSIDRILYRRFRARLAPTGLRLLPSDPSHQKFQLEIGSKAVIPLHVDTLPLKISALRGTVDLSNLANLANLTESDRPADFDLATALQLSPTDAASLAHSLCIKADHVPPARISIDFPEIDLEPGTVDPDGKVEIQLFGGEADVTNVGFYNLDTPVPETDFDLDLDGVRLDELGSWSGFGEMDGILRAYAHDVVMQAWLPTQYDFSFEAVPYSRPKVVFSPEAMKNVARLVAADAIERLPGIVKWLAFGWPRRTFGGYDLYFFGVNLFSRDGKILFSTLDPPDLPATLSDEEKRNVLERQRQNHYILYGLSFKIPLNTTQYPLFVSATEVSDYVHGMIEKFLTIAKLKEQAKLASTAKAVGSLKKAKEILWNEEHQMDCAPPAL